MNTFKTPPSSLLLKRLLIAIIRNMPRKLGNISHGVDLKFTMQS